MRAIALELNYGTAKVSKSFRNNGLTWAINLRLVSIRWDVVIFLVSP